MFPGIREKTRGWYSWPFCRNHTIYINRISGKILSEYPKVPGDFCEIRRKSGQNHAKPPAKMHKKDEKLHNASGKSEMLVQMHKNASWGYVVSV